MLRSPLFVPGNRPDMLEKALGFLPDAYVLDMEDAVPFGEKENARKITSSFLPKFSQSGPLVIPRVNSMGTGLMEDDLSAVVGPYIFGVSVGKVDSPEDVENISSALSRLERASGLRVGQIKLIPWIETARAIINAYKICSSSPRIVAVAFGAEDFTNDMGVHRTQDSSEIVYPRNVVSVAAKAADILALDTPYFSFQNPRGLHQDARMAKNYGFNGKFAIHPDQIDIINQIFSPSASEIEYAGRVVNAYQEAEQSGMGTTSLDGKVIDTPVFMRASNLLKLAELLQNSR